MSLSTHSAAASRCFPDVEPEFASIDIRARGDLSTDEKDVLVRQVEAFVLGSEEMESVYAKTGTSGDGGAEDQIGSISMNFVEWDQRRPADEILEEIRESVSGLAGVKSKHANRRTDHSRANLFPSSSRPDSRSC